jgi:lipopolysaccharide biosynthesis regulator YciM
MTLAWWLVIILAGALTYTLVLLSFERRQAGEKNPSKERYYAGLRALVRGDREIAFQRFKQSVMDDSQNIESYLRIGDLLRERGQVQKAFAIHQDLAERGGLDSEETQAIKRALAEDQIALGNETEGMRLLNELAEHSDQKAWALQRLHRLHLKREDFEAAYKVRQKLARLGEPLEPQIAALYLTLAGVKASDSGEHRRGRVLLRDALKAHGGCQAAHYYLGELYARDGRAEDAVRAWKAFLEHAPQLAGLIFPRLEKVLFEMGQYSEIAGIYQQVLGDDPVNTDALLGLALFSEKKGDDHAALGHLARVLEIDPGHLLARQKMVQIYRAAGRMDEAWQATEGFFTWLPAATEAVRCRQCGYESSEPAWYCRRCQRFDTFTLSARKSAAEVTAGVA